MKLTRFQRLILDAVQRLGPNVTVKQIYDYVYARRWMLSQASIYPTLYVMEDKKLVQHVRVTEEDNRVRYYYTALTQEVS